MAITVKHSKVSTIPDDADNSLVRPSDWNADHTLAGVGTAASLDAGVANGVATLDSSGKVPTSQIPTLSYVPYTGATGAVDLNAKSLVNVSNLGVNTTTVPTIKIRAVGDNNSSSRIAMRGYSSDANSSAIRVTKFRGTAGAPQAPQSGDSLGKFELAGYGTTSSDGYPQASLEGVATEAWGATARGTKAVVKVTPNTTTTQVTALTINQDSSATFAGAISTTGLTNSALTSGRVTYAGTSGILQDSSNFTFDGTNVNVTGTGTFQTIKVGLGAASIASNTAVGASCLTANTSGGANAAFGNFALAANTDGSGNCAFGYAALPLNTTGGGNTAFGSSAAYSTVSAGQVTAFGYFALNANTASSNDAFGWQSLRNNSTGGANAAFAQQSLGSCTTGSSNVGFGLQAGFSVTTGSSNCYFGSQATASSSSVTGEIVVGAGITGKGSNTAFIGGSVGAYNGLNAATWNIISDARIKKNVVSLESGLDVISRLRPVEFNYIKNDKHDIGFIAQEYQTVLPAQVIENEDGMLSLNQNLVPYLVKALQELNAKFDAYVASHP